MTDKPSRTANNPAAQGRLVVDADGTIHVPAFALPLSAGLSPEARLAQQKGLQSEMRLPVFSDVTNEEEYRARADLSRKTIDQGFLIPLSDALLASFPVTITSEAIAGVPVETFAPAEQRNKDHVLINLHGGGFFTGAVYGGRVESIPVANMARVKVVSIEYRQGYEHRHPAATDDILAVYGELLKTHAPGNIGIYGGSAGGRLTAQAITAIIDRGLPVPALAGILGSGAGGDGDAAFFGTIGVAEVPPPADRPVEILPAALRSSEFGYFAGVPVDDPMATPLHAPEVLLAKFPPTLFITATRAFELSQAILFHRALSRAGVDASLHVFEGLGHCFYYNAWLPESRDAYATLCRFIHRHLGIAPAVGEL